MLGSVPHQPLTVGRNRYFMESRQSATPFSTVTSIFRTPYLNVVKVMLLTSLKIALGFLLIIPGIYWSYCYMQVGYLMAENPYLTTCRAMELSKQMMDGEKWNTFVLQLSFIGWYLLCSITFGIGSSSWSLMYRPLSQSFTLRCAPSACQRIHQ